MEKSVHVCVRLQVGLTVKGEVAELLDTLLDLQQSYPSSSDLNRHPTAPGIPLHQKLSSLLPLLQASYGATLSSPDQSLLRVLLHISDIIYHTDDYKRRVQLLASDKAVAAAEAGAEGALAAAAAAAASNAARASSVRDQGESDAGSGADPGTGNGDAFWDAGAAGGMADGPITALLQGPLADARSALSSSTSFVRLTCQHWHISMLLKLGAG